MPPRSCGERLVPSFETKKVGASFVSHDTAAAQSIRNLPIQNAGYC